MSDLRPELPPTTARIARLPRDRGYPVPWFVAWIDGRPEFRVMDQRKLMLAVRDSRCWVCGETLGRYKAYVAGPMCAINTTSAEPPSHRDCAVWSAIACPFLTRPHAKRRDLPEDFATAPMPGKALARNPGVALVWVIAGKVRFKHDGSGGRLFDLDVPVETLWYCEGREATREEVMHSIETGLPSLMEMAEAESPAAVAELNKLTEGVIRDRLPVAA